MGDKFPIITISPEAPEESEAMGTKEKFWFRHEELGLCLYKKARQNTGEDWSEKIAAELCKLIKLPHAEYELASFNNEKGTISKSFLFDNSSLITGNEILAQICLDYPGDINDLSQHTLSNIFSVFTNNSVDLPLNWIPLAGISINHTLELFERIPNSLISSTAIEFAQKILEINQNKLLEFRNDNP